MNREKRNGTASGRASWRNGRRVGLRSRKRHYRHITTRSELKRHPFPFSHCREYVQRRQANRSDGRRAQVATWNATWGATRRFAKATIDAAWDLLPEDVKGKILEIVQEALKRGDGE